jgi:hypothetical protein
MPRVIYRTDAVRQYIERSEKAVLPRLMQPRTISALWLLAGLLFIGLIMAWQTKIPRYISGKAMVIRVPDIQAQTMERYMFVVFVDPVVQTNLKIGQKIFIYLPTGSISSTICRIEAQVMSPDFIRRNFNNGNDESVAGLIVNHPSLVVYAQMDSMPGNLPPNTYLGSQYKAEIEIGSQQILAMLPFIGRYFSDQHRL